MYPSTIVEENTDTRHKPLMSPKLINRSDTHKRDGKNRTVAGPHKDVSLRQINRVETCAAKVLQLFPNTNKSQSKN